MSQSLELPDPVYDALSQAASASGTSPVGWIVAHLPAPASPAPAMGGAKTLADLFAGRTGRITSDGHTAWSEESGQRFADELERKRAEGRL
jgi:hypothetical protein